MILVAGKTTINLQRKVKNALSHQVSLLPALPFPPSPITAVATTVTTTNFRRRSHPPPYVTTTPSENEAKKSYLETDVSFYLHFLQEFTGIYGVKETT